ELAGPGPVYARRDHRELGGPDAADRIGAAPARLEQPRHTAQRVEAVGRRLRTVAARSYGHAGHRRIVLRRLEDQLAGTARQPVRRVQTGHLIHQVPPRHSVALDLDEHVAVQFAEQLGDVERLAHQL